MPTIYPFRTSTGRFCYFYENKFYFFLQIIRSLGYIELTNAYEVNGTLGSLLWFPFNTHKFLAYRGLAFSGVAVKQRRGLL